MKFKKFITWLFVGAIIGWFARRMVERESRSSKITIISSDDEE